MNRFRQIPLYLACFLACVGSVACSAKAPTAVTPIKAAKPANSSRPLPITVIEQELPVTLATVWEAVAVALQQQDIQLAAAIESEHLVITEWIPMNDSLCTTATADSAPIPCQTQYRIALYRKTETATLLRIRYIEDCSSEHQVFLTCPGSKAETRMKNIVGDIRALVGYP